ncbi:hypothetical protein C0075_13915 [Rhizobium sp. KAs_5_22]|uniref:hypothetical protein n=1 Tax=Ciceribacter selenitireducens TaxID=448181 RepID=UPI00048EA10E|nr:hypothetical protein [Ciceribacter selenitireducens]PPJ46733.1 hypothetical protein C0075_13915 [Rhizobium sp. KAs_5_22]
MAVIILIRRVVRPERLEEFKTKYVAERPDHPGFIAEYLTQVNFSEELPPGLRSLALVAGNGVTFVNVAFWKSAQDFDNHFSPKPFHDPELELEDRVRVVLDIADAVGDLTAALVKRQS